MRRLVARALHGETAHIQEINFFGKMCLIRPHFIFAFFNLFCCIYESLGDPKRFAFAQINIDFKSLC